MRKSGRGYGIGGSKGKQVQLCNCHLTEWCLAISRKRDGRTMSVENGSTQCFRSDRSSHIIVRCVIIRWFVRIITIYQENAIVWSPHRGTSYGRLTAKFLWIMPQLNLCGEERQWLFVVFYALRECAFKNIARKLQNFFSKGTDTPFVSIWGVWSCYPFCQLMESSLFVCKMASCLSNTYMHTERDRELERHIYFYVCIYSQICFPWLLFKQEMGVCINYECQKDYKALTAEISNLHNTNKFLQK